MGLFSRFTGKSKAHSGNEPTEEVVEDVVEAVVEEEVAVEEPAEAPQKQGLFARLKQGLSKTRQSFGGGLARVFLGKKTIDEDLFEEIETILLSADVGVDATTDIIDSLTDESDRKILKNPEELMQALKTKLGDLLTPVAKPLEIDASHQPFVLLMVGVNGAGKTTTIGKLARKYQQEGKKVMLAAGDTFRAAAVEQLQVWGERNNIDVVAQHTGADSASVIFDAIEKAKARGIDVIIADTAGRLHNKAHLMNELEKIVRVMKKFDESAPHETMLVVDAGNGQNALAQAMEFNKTAPLSGITVTKLDGTAKGGIVFAIAKALQTPIRFIGVGEAIDDLRVFEKDAFIDALFDQED